MAELEIEDLVEKVLQSRKNANNLIHIIACINPQKDEKLIISSSNGAVKIFRSLIFNEDVNFDSNHELSSVEQYKAWISKQYSKCYVAMLKCLPGMSGDNKPVLLGFCMELLKQKSQFLNKSPLKSKEMFFSETELQELIKIILFESGGKLSTHFHVYMKFDDVRYFVMKVFPAILCDRDDHCNIKIVLTFLELLSSCMPVDGVQLNNSFVFESLDLCDFFPCKTNAFSIMEQRKLFSRAWLEVMKLPFPAAIHKRVLITLHSTLIPNFSKPRLLADFLIRSFKCGGGLALLGLQGLFVLMNEHNLEYPDFYVNFYSMLHPRIFDKKYKARFFHLLQLFLSSTHISVYLVAAFVKKLSRLSLVAPPNCISIILSLMSKLLLQHPTLSHLINQNKESFCADKDVFLYTEQNPVNCRAMESSLWEINCHLQHYSPNVAKAAANIMHLQADNDDLNMLLDDDYVDIIDFESRELVSHTMNHIQPNNLFGGYEDLTTKIWAIE